MFTMTGFFLQGEIFGAPRDVFDGVRGNRITEVTKHGLYYNSYNLTSLPLSLCSSFWAFSAELCWFFYHHVYNQETVNETKKNTMWLLGNASSKNETILWSAVLATHPRKFTKFGEQEMFGTSPKYLLLKMDRNQCCRTRDAFFCSTYLVPT